MLSTRAKTITLAFLVHYSLAATSAPDYVSKYAPLVWIDVNDPYYPGDLGGFLGHVRPERNFTAVDSSTTLALDNLATLNAASGCSVQNPGACDIYLTSKDNLTSDPIWTHGVIPDSQGKTNGAVSSTIITVDHGSGILDAFYFYWYPFNLGLQVLGNVAGNHLGDWEHTMARFKNGVPQAYWLSVHDSGQTYTYDALQKNGSRPVVYSGLGGHSNYPTPGNHSRNLGIITVNDTTSAGTLWDPIKNAYWFSFTPSTGAKGSFSALEPTSTAPISWLYFAGKWGDKQYPNNDSRQFSFADLAWKWEDGPTGPIDKDLNRSAVCPDRVSPCDTTTSLPAISGNTRPAKTVSLGFTTTAQATTTTTAGSSSGSGSGSQGPTGTTSSPAASSTTGGAALSLDDPSRKLLLAAGLCYAVRHFGQL